MVGSSATAARWKKSSRLDLLARAARWGMAGSNLSMARRLVLAVMLMVASMSSVSSLLMGFCQSSWSGVASS